MFNLKEGHKMLTGQYRIEPLDWSKIVFKYGAMVVRRRRILEPNKVKRLIDAIQKFNKIVEEVNY